MYRKEYQEFKSNADIALKKYENKIVNLQGDIQLKMERIKDLTNLMSKGDCSECERYKIVLEKLRRGPSAP